MSQEPSASASTSQPAVGLEFIHKNGGKILLRAGHQYVKHRDNKNGSVKWRCSNYRKKCKSGLTITYVSILTIHFT